MRRLRKARWAIRRWRRYPGSALRWWQQGRPRTAPVVVGVGQLVEHEDGRKNITGWHLDCRFQRESITPDALWDHLVALGYEVQRG